MRDHIICVAADESVLSLLLQQLGAWLGESYALDGVRSAPGALRLFDDLMRAGETVAVLLVEQSLAAERTRERGDLDGRSVGDSGVALLMEAHQRFPHAGKVLLIDRNSGRNPGRDSGRDSERNSEGNPERNAGSNPGPNPGPNPGDHAEVLAQGVRHAGLSSYLYQPYEALQLRLTVEGLLFQYRLQRKNERLLYTLQDQKRELEVMNHNLEARIRERTMALEEANRRLSQLAVTDGLTGLFNHRYLQEHLVLEVERSLRTGIPLGMLMVDVDNFRLYNNRFGHQTGDEVLRRVARLIGEHRRVNDVVARYGGEEFALLLINADHRVAANIAERLRARVCAEPFPQNHELPGGMLTISVGVASCPTDGTTAASLLAAADAALFRAKHAGRNQVRVAGDPSEVFYVNVGVGGAQSDDQMAVTAAAGGAPEKW